MTTAPLDLLTLHRLATAARDAHAEVLRLARLPDPYATPDYGKAVFASVDADEGFREAADCDVVLSLLARLQEAERQLSHVDGVLARRPALDDCADRVAKIEKCIATAKQVDDHRAQQKHPAAEPAPDA